MDVINVFADFLGSGVLSPAIVLLSVDSGLIPWNCHSVCMFFSVLLSCIGNVALIIVDTPLCCETFSTKQDHLVVVLVIKCLTSQDGLGEKTMSFAMAHATMHMQITACFSPMNCDAQCTMDLIVAVVCSPSWWVSRIGVANKRGSAECTNGFWKGALRHGDCKERN